MVRPLFPAATAAKLKVVRARGFETIRLFHDDAYACWTVNRSAGWADNTAVEAQAAVETGYGKLYANGKGGPQSGEMVIHLESPYRFRALATANIVSGNLLVINTDRLFRVDIVKPEDTDDLLMDVYLTELFNTPIPEVPSAPVPEVP